MTKKLRLESLQTSIRDGDNKALQNAVSIKPPGYFEDLLGSKEPGGDDVVARLSERLKNTDDRLSFSRHRLLDIDWDNILPESVYSEEIDLKYTKTFFEETWGMKPYSHRNISQVATKQRPIKYMPNSATNDQAIRKWDFRVATLREYIFLEYESQIYWIISNKPIDFVTQYEESWGLIDLVLLVKKGPPPPDRNEDRVIDIMDDTEEMLARLRRGATGFRPTFDHDWITVAFEDVYPQLVAYIEANVKIEDQMDPGALRNLVENEWAFEQPVPTETMFYKYPGSDTEKLWVVDKPAGDGKTREVPTGSAIHNGHMVVQDLEFTELATNEIVLIDTTSGRKYWMKFNELQSVKNVEIENTNDWDNIWINDVEEVVLLTKTDIETVPSVDDSSVSESIIIGRNEARVILEQYARLVAEKGLVSLLRGKYQGWLDKNSEPSAIAQINLNQQSEQLMSLALRDEEIAQNLNHLKATAADLGYELFLEDYKGDGNEEDYQPFKHQDKAPASIRDLKVVKPKAGSLYIKKTQSVEWKEKHTRKVQQRRRNGRTWLGRRKYKWVTVDVPYVEERKSSYVNFIPVDPGTEPWVEHKDRLESNGYMVHVLDQIQGEYVSSTGLALSEIVERCRVNEQYRKICVLFLPEYDHSFRAGVVITKYHVIKKPLPGIVPIGLPVVRVRENLSFRKTFAGVELGDLIKSMALAPGEKRSVSFRRKYERKVDSRRTTKNYLDIVDTSQDSFDVALENEVRYDSKDESSNTSGSSASVTGQYKGVSGALDLSDESSDSSSLNQFSKNFQSTAKKAARSYKKNIRDEATTSYRDIVSSENDESVTSEVENINQGSTLNILYHRLHNVYLCSLFVEDFQFQITHPIELVQGTGITTKQYFNRFQVEEFKWYLEEFSKPYERVGVEQTDVSREVFENLKGIVKSDYTENLKAVFSWEEEKSASFVDALESLTIGNEPLETYFIDSISNAIYADAVLGCNPATEPYSEAMRAARLNRERAEIRLVHSQASTLMPAGIFTEVAGYSFRASEIDGWIKVSVNEDLPEGDWTVLCAGVPHAKMMSGMRMISFSSQGLNEDDIASVRIVNLGQLLEIMPE